MNTQDNESASAYFLKYSPHYLRFLADAREALAVLLSACQQEGWHMGRDVRATFPLRMMNLSRGLSYLVASATLARDNPTATLLAAQLDPDDLDGSLHTVPVFLWWGTLATWFGAFEMAVVDLARGICEQDPEAQVALFVRRGSGDQRRRTGEICDDLANYCFCDHEDVRRFRSFVSLASRLRNQIHWHGISAPWMRAEELVEEYKDWSLTFRRGEPPAYAKPELGYCLWLMLFPAAVDEWRSLLGSSAIISLRSEITDSHVVADPPDWAKIVS